MSKIKLPYFDYLFSQLASNNESIEKSFGRHVHWGYWDRPKEAICSDEDYAQAAENLTIQLVKCAKVKDDENILDVGCGFGGTIAYLNENFNNMQLTGLNIDNRQLIRAKHLVLGRNNNHIEFIQANACKLPFEDNSFDNILAVECIFHFPNREEFLREASRVLKPNGRIILSDFVPSTLFYPIARFMTSPYLSRFSIFGDCKVNYTLSRYRKLSKQLDLEIQTRNITANTIPTYRYLKKFLGKSNSNKHEATLIKFGVNLMGWFAKSRFLNYKIMCFKKV